MSKRLSGILAYFLGALSDCLYVNITGSDLANCGSISRPCRSLAFTVNNVSSINDTICLIASPIKQIAYIVENPIVIKNSLAVTKFPGYSQNPVITYHLNTTSNWKVFYAFAISRYFEAPGILTVNFKSVDFKVNILTTFSEGFKTPQKNVLVKDIFGLELSLSISDSIISSPSHAINFSDLSRYENISIHLKNLEIKNGAFTFENKKGRCQPMEHIKDMIEMDNVTICNAVNVALNVNGCFNVSIKKLTCSKITWKKQELLAFRGGVLNIGNTLIKDILVDNNMKYNNSDRRTLLFIDESVSEIQNMLIKDTIGTSSKRPEIFSAVLFFKNSTIKILNMEMVGNSFQNFAKAEKSSLYVKNITLSRNNFTGTLYSVGESDLKLYESNVYNNQMGSFVYINLNSKVYIMSNSLTENAIFENAYSIARSQMELHNTKSRSNKMNNFMFAKSQSHILIYNIMLTNNHFSRTIYNVSGKSKLELYEAKFLQNIANLILLIIRSNSSAEIRNNSLMKNYVSEAVYHLSDTSNLQLTNVDFIRNNVTKTMLFMRSNSSAMIYNNTLTENNFLGQVYYLNKNSIIHLNHVAFTRNKLMLNLLLMETNSSAIIQNNTLNENNFSSPVYHLYDRNTIHMNHVAFTRNKLMTNLLVMKSNSSSIIQNNTLTENNFSCTVYFLFENNTIHLNHVVFIRNRVKMRFLHMILNCVAKLINNTIVGNNVNKTMVLGYSSYLGIDTILMESNTFSRSIFLSNCSTSLDSIQIKGNKVMNDIIYVVNTGGKMTNSHIENSGNLMASAVSITCTYSGCKDFSFEITNFKIEWSYQLLHSVRPIVKLHEKVMLLDIKLLVTSITEIEVLRYSIQDVILPKKTGLQIVTNVNNISSLFIGCVKANVKHFTALGTWRCVPCARGTYTINNGSLKISTNFESNKTIVLENANCSCLDCPVGANCTVSIKSKSNFYGYKTKEEKLEFLPCPNGFCCTGNQCNTVRSCNKKRFDTLCGRCIEGYMESFLSTNCVLIRSCQTFAKFWLVYFIYVLTLATFLYYMKDFLSLIKSMGSKVSKIFQPCRKEKDCAVEMDGTISVAGTEEERDKIPHFTISGTFALIVSFYQIKQLMNVDVQYNNSKEFSFNKFISKCFNLDIVTVSYYSYCPMSNLDAVSKIFIKTYLLTGTLLIASILNYFMSRVFHSFCLSRGLGPSLKPSDRLGVSIIRILMLSYKNMARASLILLNCVEVAGVRMLFIKGDMKCFQWWQIVTAVFLFTWIMFFPWSLKVSYSMFMKDKISFPKLIWCLIVPFTVITTYRLNRNVTSFDLQKVRNTYEVKEILKEIFEESYRLKTSDAGEETVFYETWRLYQRFLLAVVATFCINPLVRITLLTPIVLLIAIFYLAYEPFKPEMFILHWMEVFSILGIFVCLTHNMFRGVLYVYDINYEYPVTFVLKGFVILDVIFTPFCVLIYFFIVKPICNKAKCKIKYFYWALKRD